MKAKRIVSTSFILLIAAVLAISGVLKIAGAEPKPVMDFLIAFGMGPYLALLGVTQLIIAAALLIPATNKIGFLLACCYFGGALCLEIAGAQPLASAAFLVLLWVGMFLRNRELFVSQR